MQPIPHKLPIRRAMVAVLLGGAILAAPAAGDVTNQQVQDAIRKAIAHLRNTQNANGMWRSYGSYKAGNTALAALSLLNAGVPANDPDVAKAVAAVARAENKYTYVVSLKCQVLAAADPEAKRYGKQLQAAADWLVKTQLANGMWTYSPNRGRFGRGDNSNTQFALLGLHEAAKAGARIPGRTWRLSRLHFTNTQLRDGGWTYHFQANMDRRRMAHARSYGSMTAAGVASLYICGQRLHVTGPKRLVDGAWPSCGRFRQNIVIAKGLEWLADNFSVRENPNRRTSWLHYYLYALERVGMISGQQTFGRHDWYRKGAAFLVDSQGKDGSWGRQSYDTAFALLFLAKGNRPVIVQKLLWAEPSQSHRNIHDLENLTVFLDDKLGQRTTWQTVGVDASLADWRLSPILFITGHTFPKFTPAQEKKLKAYVDAGGTILAEACCGSDDFAKGLRQLIERLWPKYPLRALPSNHPVFGSYFELSDTYGLEGMDIGCRTGLFFSPRALSCLWEMQDLVQDGKAYSRQALQIGTNIAAYATGREKLSNKLDLVDLGAAAEKDKPAEIPRGAVRIARLYHRGDYQADPRCLANLASLLREQAQVSVVSRGRHIKADDEAIYQYPVVFMTGHNAFEMPEAQVTALRKYLQRGGFLFADACCGRKAFDASFRKLAARLFPDQKLDLLPADHPILAGKAGRPLGRLTYRRFLQDELQQKGVADFKGTNRPQLEAVRIDGRAVLLYSPIDFSCGLEGDKPYACRGYVDADAKKLALNIVLYAISY